MRREILILFVLGTTKLFGQNPDPYVSMDFSYGYKTLYQNYGQTFNSLNHFDFNKPIQEVAIICTSSLERNRKNRFYGYLGAFMPQDITIDTLKCKVTGLNFGMAEGRDIFAKQENLDFLVCIGYNIGYIKTYNNVLLNQYNFYFSPKIGLRPRLKVNKIVFSALIEYEYDVTKPVWKKSMFSGDNKLKMSNHWQTGLTTMIGIGYKLY